MDRGSPTAAKGPARLADPPRVAQLGHRVTRGVALASVVAGAAGGRHTEGPSHERPGGHSQSSPQDPSPPSATAEQPAGRPKRSPSTAGLRGSGALRAREWAVRSLEATLGLSGCQSTQK